MKNIINFPDKQKVDKLPTNLIKVDSSKTVRIPIIDKFYEIDGELFYVISGDSTPRKWADYKLEDFNERRE